MNWEGKHCPFCGRKLQEKQGNYWNDDEHENGNSRKAGEKVGQ